MDIEKLKGLKILRKEKTSCPGLGLRCIPYFGQYGEQYKFMIPITVIKPTSLEGLKELPPKVKKAVNDFANSYPEGDLDLFIINWNAESILKESLSEKKNYTRINYITHPYVFYDLAPGQHNNANVFMSLYKVSELDGLSPIKESDAVPIDAEFLLGTECQRSLCTLLKCINGEKITMCLSPNNAAFKLSTGFPICSFFSLSVVTCYNYGRLLISLHTILTNSEIPLMRNIDELFNRKKMLAISLDLEGIIGSDIYTAQDKIYTRDLKTVFDQVCVNVRNVLSEAAENFSTTEKSNRMEVLQEMLQYSGAVLLSGCKDFSKIKPEEYFLGEFFLKQFYKFMLSKLYCQRLHKSYAKTFIKDFVGCCPISCQIGFFKLYFEALIAVYRKNVEYQLALLKQFSVESKFSPKIPYESGVIPLLKPPYSKINKIERFWRGITSTNSVDGMESLIVEPLLPDLNHEIQPVEEEKMPAPALYSRDSPESSIQTAYNLFPENTYLCEFIPSEIPEVSIFYSIIKKLLHNPYAKIEAEISLLSPPIRNYLYFSV